MADRAWGEVTWGYNAWGGIGVEQAVTGVAASGAVDATVGLAAVPLTGVSATGGTGGLSYLLTVQESTGWGSNTWGHLPWGFGEPGGVPLVGEVGDVVPAIPISLTGFELAGQLGNILHTISKTPEGVQAAGGVGSVTFRFWNTINDTQDPGWVQVSGPQSAGWNAVNTEQETLAA